MRIKIALCVLAFLLTGCGGGGGGDRSRDAQATPLSIRTQPADASVVEGDAASFAVDASGSGTLKYQWHRDDVAVAGANDRVYTLANANRGDDGASFSVQVTDEKTTIASRVATLTVVVPVSYLARLLASIPEGGWVKVNSNSFSEAWPTGADRAPPTPGGPYQIIPAWSGFAWDTRRSNLILFGGGHANYVGNEVYVWQGSDGRWTRGSLPSRVDLSTSLVEGNGAPQSAHTYQLNSYAPLVDRFVVFGGAAWNSGGPLVDVDGRTGPWWWDPDTADPDRVGGQDGTGWDPTRAGSSAWEMRPDSPWPPDLAGPYYTGTSAYREEDGQDVIYVSIDSQASGWPSLYRHQLGTLTATGRFERVGTPSGRAVMYAGAAAIDSRAGLFVHTAVVGAAQADLAVWRLADNNAANPELNVDTAVQLIDAAGTPVDLDRTSSIAYDSVNDQFVIWDSQDRGTVWITRSTFTSDGSIAPVWSIRRVPSTTAAQPLGSHFNGVLGKWKYAPELRAFVALDSPPEDGDVWLYKPPR